MEYPAEYKSVYELFRAVSMNNTDKVAMKFKQGDEWVSRTWGEHYDRTTQIARALMASGIQKDDKVCVLSATRLEWVQCDLAIGTAGGVTVGIYPSNLPNDCKYIIDQSDAVLVFVENQEQLDKILEVRDQIGDVRNVIIFDGQGTEDGYVLSFDDFLKNSDEVSVEEMEARAATIETDDLASIVYTSGTTGLPKGAMLTHGNLLFTSWSAEQSIYLEPHFETLLFLPLAHVFARIIVYSCLRAALCIAFAESIEKVGENLRETSPHFIASVPRIFEKVYTKISSGVEDAGGIKAKLFHWAIGVGRQVSRLLQEKKPIPGGLNFKYGLANKLVFGKIKQALGGRLVFAISGAAPLDKSLAEFFHACGVLILEGIGMTENTSFTNVNRFDNNRFGTTGQVGPGIEQKIAEDGEILYRGPCVMKGYYKMEEETAEAIDKDGWLHTGDIGEIDGDGFLRVTDRKKDIIVTSGGKNVAPQHVENIMKGSRYISQVMTYGDKRKYLSALVTLDEEQITAWAEKEGVAFESYEELTQKPEVYGLIQNEIEERNKQLASYETLKKFKILSNDFTIESGDLTPSMKVKRKAVTQKFMELLDGMYED